MSNLLPLLEDTDFSFVRSKAKDIAVTFKEVVDIKKTHSGWTIFVSSHILETINSNNEEKECNDGYEEGAAEDPYIYDDPYEDEQRLLNEELADDHNSWTRSEEDGWYYED